MKQSNEISKMNQSAQQSDNMISAWMDGDAQTDLPESLKTPEGQATWDLYHLIGDTLRTPDLAVPGTRSLQNKISQALEQEPAIIATIKPHHGANQRLGAAVQRPSKSWGKSLWPGVAMAAAIATVVWVAKPFLIPEFSSPVEHTAEVIVNPPARPSEVALNTPIVRDYVSMHREISGPANVRHVSFGAMR